MLLTLKQEISPRQTEALATETSIKEIALGVPEPVEKNLNRYQLNKNLPGVCEQLPHHCIQLCLLS